MPAKVPILSTLCIVVLALSFVACVKKGGEAVVIGKDYVAAREGEGPASDTRATTVEQWILKVEMRDDMRKVDVQVEPPEWQKLQVGDRVKVRYSQGKYTGTIWYSELK